MQRQLDWKLQDGRAAEAKENSQSKAVPAQDASLYKRVGAQNENTAHCIVTDHTLADLLTGLLNNRTKKTFQQHKMNPQTKTSAKLSMRFMTCVF